MGWKTDALARAIIEWGDADQASNQNGRCYDNHKSRAHKDEQDTGKAWKQQKAREQVDDARDRQFERQARWQQEKYDFYNREEERSRAYAKVTDHHQHRGERGHFQHRR